MGVAELIVALCLQAEPGACMVIHRKETGALATCVVIREAEELTPSSGYYLARWT